MNAAGATFTAPGWFGKLPGSGDFVHRRLEAAFIVRWDAWLQHEMLAMRQRHSEWVASYLTAPLWCFVLAPGLLEVRGAQGILMSSVDRVGRYFPLTLIRWFADDACEATAGNALRRRWWALAARAALDGLAGDLDAKGFDDLVQQTFSSLGEGADSMAAPATDLPAPGQSLWCILDQGGQPARTLLSTGLPTGADFDTLFDLSAWPHSALGAL